LISSDDAILFFLFPLLVKNVGKNYVRITNQLKWTLNERKQSVNKEESIEKKYYNSKTLIKFELIS